MAARTSATLAKMLNSSMLKLWRETRSAMTFSMVRSREMGICPSTARSPHTTHRNGARGGSHRDESGMTLLASNLGHRIYRRAAAVARSLVTPPVRVLTPAGPLNLRWDEADILLAGPAEIVAAGEFFWKGNITK
jgi:hypothetical protein